MFRRLLALVLAFVVCVVGCAKETPSAQYDRVLEELSEKPVAERWAVLKAPDLSPNIRNMFRTYAQVEGRGGVMVAVGVLQNLALIPHARPDKVVFVDINPAANEAILRFVLWLIEQSPTRLDFMSWIYGNPLTERDVKYILEPVQPTGSTATTARGIHDEMSEYLVKFVPEHLLGPEEQKTMLASLMTIYYRGLPEHLTEQQRDEALKWFNTLLKEMRSVHFLVDQGWASWTAHNDAERRQLASWLSTEENYQLVRRYWLEGRMVAVTGDIGGPSVGKIAKRLGKAQVTVLYLSCIPDDDAAEAVGRRIYKTLQELPISQNAVVVGGFHTNSGDKGDPEHSYALPYTIVSWSYDYLNPQDELVRLLIAQRPLIGDPVLGPDEFRNRLLQGVNGIMQYRKIPHDEDGLSGYVAFVDSVLDSPDLIRKMDPDQFTEWTRKTSKVDTGTDIFRAAVIALVEKGIIQPPVSARLPTTK